MAQLTCPTKFLSMQGRQVISAQISVLFLRIGLFFRQNYIGNLHLTLIFINLQTCLLLSIRS